MNIGLIMRQHPPTRTSPIMPRVVDLLREWGARVEVVYPEEELTDLESIAVRHDIYVLKSGSELALSFAGALDALGAVIVNPYPAAASLRDKIVATRILQAAGLPVPETHITGDMRQAERVLAAGPVIVKPYRGSEGRGIEVVRSADEFPTVPEGPIFVQRYHQPDGLDHKIYSIGARLFGVRRRWPVRTFEDKLGEPFTLTCELRDIAEQCGRAFGLDLFGVDVVFSDGRPLVVDMSSFPGFKGVPHAALRLADFVYNRARRAEDAGAEQNRVRVAES